MGEMNVCLETIWMKFEEAQASIWIVDKEAENMEFDRSNWNWNSNRWVLQHNVIECFHDHEKWRFSTTCFNLFQALVNLLIRIFYFVNDSNICRLQASWVKKGLFGLSKGGNLTLIFHPQLTRTHNNFEIEFWESFQHESMSTDILFFVVPPSHVSLNFGVILKSTKDA